MSVSVTMSMQQFVAGLKSRSEETRAKAARDLHHYVSTELREVSVEDLTSFMDDMNHQIYEMVSSADVSDKKGGILAIGECPALTSVTRKGGSSLLVSVQC